MLTFQALLSHLLQTPELHRTLFTLTGTCTICLRHSRHSAFIPASARRTAEDHSCYIFEIFNVRTSHAPTHHAQNRPAWQGKPYNIRLALAEVNKYCCYDDDQDHHHRCSNAEWMRVCLCRVEDSEWRGPGRAGKRNRQHNRYPDQQHWTTSAALLHSDSNVPQRLRTLPRGTNSNASHVNAK